MQDVVTEWKDKTFTLNARLSADQMVFNHDGESVAHIDKDGNLHVKGEVIELNDPSGLVLVHANTSEFHIWHNPHVYYNDKRMTALLVNDLNTMNGLQYPACFWDEKDFYVWGKLNMDSSLSVNSMITITPSELPGYGMYHQITIRGNVVKEEINNESKAEAEQTTI